MATIYRRGQTYWIKWYEGGEPKYESLKTRDKKAALLAKAAKEVELLTGGVSVAQANSTFAEFAERYLAWHAGEYPWSKTEMRYSFDTEFLPRFGHYRLASLDPQVVERWKRERLGSIGHVSQRPLTRSYMNSQIKKLKAVFNKAVEWGVIPRNPIAAVKTFQKLESSPRKHFSADELQAIYQTDPANAPIWKLLANTGMRLGEAMNLKWENVHEEYIRVLSTSEHYTKSRKWRDIPISPGCREALDALGRKGMYVLPKVGKVTLRTRFKAACAAAGLEGTPHELRHTFISHLVMQSVPLRTVQVLAGHSSITVTEQYAHLAPNHIAQSVAGLSL